MQQSLLTHRNYIFRTKDSAQLSIVVRFYLCFGLLPIVLVLSNEHWLCPGMTKIVGWDIKNEIEKKKKKKRKKQNILHQEFNLRWDEAAWLVVCMLYASS